MIVKCVYEGEDYDSSMDLFIDGKCVFSVYNMGECPEDANLMRDLNFAYFIPDLLKQAYEAGKNKEPFEIVHVDNI